MEAFDQIMERVGYKRPVNNQEVATDDPLGNNLLLVIIINIIAIPLTSVSIIVALALTAINVYLLRAEIGERISKR